MYPQQPFLIIVTLTDFYFFPYNELTFLVKMFSNNFFNKNSKY